MNSIDELKSFCLEGKSRDGNLWVVSVDHSPFTIGRKEGSSLFLAAEGVSRKHAEIIDISDGWILMDCGSVNGTYVNGKRLSGVHQLRLGDNIRIADIVFEVVEHVDESECTMILNPYSDKMEEMLDLKVTDPHFQPLVSLDDGALCGYEILGRVNFKGLPNNPLDLFDISRSLDRQVELSELFRDSALRHATKVGIKELILFNTLPEEMDIRMLRPSLSRLRQTFPGLKLGMELHENAITDAGNMKELRKLLQELDILLVYDDFGAGQSRLIELLDFVPDILKFDIALIKNINLRPKASRDIVESLVKMARSAGIRTLAEGIENIEEAEVCKSIGFELGQGFYFGRPARLQHAAVDSTLS
jgi:EAL domain-containing protein (putative c-di-GMP-specific phosphodiesterase class I)